MRIAFDAKRIFNNHTGLGNYGRTLVKSLAEKYKETYFLYAPKIPKTAPESIFLDETTFTLRHAHGKQKQLWRSFGITKQLAKDNIDIYHGLSNELPYKLKCEGIKSVVTIHDLIFKTLPKTYSLVDKFIYNKKFKSACLRADKVVAISESTKQDIIKFYDVKASKIEVIYQSCNALYFEPKNEALIKTVQKKYGLPNAFILYVGSVIERKNVLLVLKGLKGLPKQEQLPIVIVGSGGKYADKVKHYAKKNKLTHLLIWLNSVEDIRALKCVYHLATVFVYPSIYEGFGIPIIEALLCGVPVITSNCSSLPEAAGPGSIKIDANSVEEMKEALHLVLSNKEKREEMIKLGFAYAQQFNAEDIADKYMQVYKKLIQ